MPVQKSLENIECTRNIASSTPIGGGSYLSGEMQQTGWELEIN